MSKERRGYWAIETPEGDVIPETCGSYRLLSWLNFFNLLRQKPFDYYIMTVEHAEAEGYKAVKLVRAENENT